MHVVVLNTYNIVVSLSCKTCEKILKYWSKTTFPEALTDCMYSPSTGPGHFIVSNQNVQASLGEYPEGAPLPGDAHPVYVVVCHGYVLGLHVSNL